MRKEVLLDALTNLLASNLDPKYFDVSYTQVAKEVLQLCQEYGMKPPVEKFDPVLLTTKHTWSNE